MRYTMPQKTAKFSIATIAIWTVSEKERSTSSSLKCPQPLVACHDQTTLLRSIGRRDAASLWAIRRLAGIGQLMAQWLMSQSVMVVALDSISSAEAQSTSWRTSCIPRFRRPSSQVLLMALHSMARLHSKVLDSLIVAAWIIWARFQAVCSAHLSISMEWVGVVPYPQEIRLGRIRAGVECNSIVLSATISITKLVPLSIMSCSPRTTTDHHYQNVIYEHLYTNLPLQILS